jgi:hypothetical protein
MISDRLTKEILTNLYVAERMTTRRVAAQFGIGHRRVVDLLHKYGIKPRNRGCTGATLEEKFDKKYKVVASGCWEWQAFVSSDGYGRFNVQRGEPSSAHRYSYARFKGCIPDGCEIDHLCRNRRCVNPEHLEAVSKKTNILRGEGPTAINARKLTCKYGHTLVRKPWQRVCPECRRVASLKWWKTKRSGQP